MKESAVFVGSDSLVLAEGDSKAPSPPMLSSLTVEPHDLWPRPGDKENDLRMIIRLFSLL